MPKRKPNKSQYWRCPACKKVTKHGSVSAQMARPDWGDEYGVRTYHRFHECERCHHQLLTVQMTEADFMALNKDRETLQAVRRALRQKR